MKGGSLKYVKPIGALGDAPPPPPPGAAPASMLYDEEAERKKEEEAKRKAEEEARIKAEEEARLKAEEEARLKAEEEARIKAEEEARIKAEEEAKAAAEEEARRKAEEEAKAAAEEEARRKSEEEAAAAAAAAAEEEKRKQAEEEAAAVAAEHEEEAKHEETEEAAVPAAVAEHEEEPKEEEHEREVHDEGEGEVPPPPPPVATEDEEEKHEEAAAEEHHEEVQHEAHEEEAAPAPKEEEAAHPAEEADHDVQATAAAMGEMEPKDDMDDAIETAMAPAPVVAPIEEQHNEPEPVQSPVKGSPFLAKSPTKEEGMKKSSSRDEGLKSPTALGSTPTKESPAKAASDADLAKKTSGISPAKAGAVAGVAGAAAAGAAVGAAAAAEPAVAAPPPPPKERTMDTPSMARRYLMTTVGPLVKAGIAKIAKERPDDPIEAMAKFLEEQHPNPKVKPVIFVFGSHGSGKDVCCQRLEKDFGWKWIQAGDVLRSEVEAKSEDGLIIEDCIKNGKTVPSEIGIRLLQKTLQFVEGPGVLLDGFPRKIDQAGQFEKEVPGFRGALYFNVKKEVALERVLAQTKAYTSYNPTERFENRWNTFITHTTPMVDYYRGAGKLTEVNSSRHPEDVYADVRPHFAPIFK
eukprot:CAMPEP_0184692458 /NCGR_PEP_ID=MMETSP0313-20130426/934_1 /TAXON_ID=2792 /ORGANISM="Porphyridium aerugineum, Strain SAG 1380-2" /LENGTH=633 /DNA_ID=CAMNT_0027150291 /DNA_START=197 /DNA_END=2098 /DNA_ORIENTATION=-